MALVLLESRPWSSRGRDSIPRAGETRSVQILVEDFALRGDLTMPHVGLAAHRLQPSTVMVAVRKILVPIDFSPASRAALELAVALADRFDAAVDVLHVIQIPAVAYATPGVVAVAPVPFEVSPQERAKVEADLRAFVAEVAPKRSGISVRLTVENPAEAILEAAQAGKHDLIAMGTHGRTGLKRIVVGSVAETVIRKAPCAVLTTHSPKTEAVS
jgi:universal stress protein A